MENDIRVERTKSALREAFVQLLKDTPIYSISVTNLTKTAKVSRVTFYIHYTDMTDFIEKICDGVLSEIKWMPSKDLNIFVLENSELIIRKQIENVYENLVTFRALLGKNGPDQFERKIIELISREYLFHVVKHSEKFKDEKDMDALINYVAAGEIQLVTEWIKNEALDPMDDMVERIVNLTFKGIFKSYGLMEM